MVTRWLFLPSIWLITRINLKHKVRDCVDEVVIWTFAVKPCDELFVFDLFNHGPCSFHRPCCNELQRTFIMCIKTKE